MTPHIPVAVGSMASSIEPTATGIEETLRKRRRTRATKCSLSFSLHVERNPYRRLNSGRNFLFFFSFLELFSERRRGRREDGGRSCMVACARSNDDALVDIRSHGDSKVDGHRNRRAPASQARPNQGREEERVERFC